MSFNNLSILFLIWLITACSNFHKYQLYPIGNNSIYENPVVFVGDDIIVTDIVYQKKQKRIYCGETLLIQGGYSFLPGEYEVAILLHKVNTGYGTVNYTARPSKINIKLENGRAYKIMSRFQENKWLPEIVDITKDLTSKYKDDVVNYEKAEVEFCR